MASRPDPTPSLPCSRCGEPVAEGFDACWRCGRPLPEDVLVREPVPDWDELIAADLAAVKSTPLPPRSLRGELALGLVSAIAFWVVEHGMVDAPGPVLRGILRQPTTWRDLAFACVGVGFAVGLLGLWRWARRSTAAWMPRRRA